MLRGVRDSKAAKAALVVAGVGALWWVLKGRGGKRAPVVDRKYDISVAVMRDMCKPADRMVNADLLRLAIQETTEQLFVVISAECPMGVVPSHMLDMHDLVWQLQLEAKRLRIDCVVVNRDGDGGTVSLAEILKFPSVQHMYTSAENLDDSMLLRRANDFRASKGLKRLSHSIHTELTTKYTTHTFFSSLSESPPQYPQVCIGGTFDRLHMGHKKLLLFAAMVCSERLTIGMAGPALLTKKSSRKMIEEVQDRIDAVRAYLNAVKPKLKLTFSILTDPYGPSITNPALEAIVVSSETMKGADKINDERAKRGMAPLRTLIVNRENNFIVSSTFVRDLTSKSDWD